MTYARKIKDFLVESRKSKVERQKKSTVWCSFPLGLTRAAHPRCRRKPSVAGKPLVRVPKLRFSRKYSGQLRSPQELKFPGTPWKV